MDAAALAAPGARRGARGRRRAEPRGRRALARRARERASAREALLRAAAESEAVHAYRDAAAADRQALDLWPEGDDEQRRGEALERYARCSRLAGELAEAARAWRELAALHGAAGDELALARAQRRARGGAPSSRATARPPSPRAGRPPTAYAANGRPAEAAVELLAMANQRRLAARHGEAIELAQAARAQAEAAGRLDLRIRARRARGHGDRQARRLRGAGSRRSAAASRWRSSTT